MRPTRLLVSLALGALAACSAAPAAQAPDGAATPRRMAGQLAVVELFQSQGCSSCPPAIANVNAIADQPDILALTFAVTYWDQLGWKDTFAKQAFTDRQWDYARARGSGEVFTPQIVVNGRTSIVGARRAQLDQALAATPATASMPAIALHSGEIAIAAGKTPRAASVWLVDYDPRARPVPIRAGENGGRTIIHRNIVTGLTRLGSWTGPAVQFRLPAAQAGLDRAVLVQLDRAGPIISAAKL